MSALSHTPFLLVWSGALVSNLGNWIESICQAWLVYDKSGHSTTWTGLLMCVGILPMTILALPMGVVADRFNRRKLLLIIEILMALGALLQAVACHMEWTSPRITVAIALFEGLCAGAVGPVWHSLVPELVPREDLGTAIALNSAQFNVARSVGPMIAALIIAQWGYKVAFDLNVASFALVIVALAVVRTKETHQPRPDKPRGLSAVLDGLTAVRAHPGMFRLITSGFVFVLFTASIFALLPAIATRQLGGKEETFSSLMSAIGVGAVVAVFFIGRLTASFTRQAVMASAALLTGFALGALGFTHDWYVAIALLFAFGFGWCVLLTTQNTALQMLTPDAIRARVMSVNVLAFIAAPIGQQLFGWVAEKENLDVGRTLALLGAGAVAVGVFNLASKVPEIEGSLSTDRGEAVLVEA
jgi:MFS family permease